MGISCGLDYRDRLHLDQEVVAADVGNHTHLGDRGYPKKLGGSLPCLVAFPVLAEKRRRLDVIQGASVLLEDRRDAQQFPRHQPS